MDRLQANPVTAVVAAVAAAVAVAAVVVAVTVAVAAEVVAVKEEKLLHRAVEDLALHPISAPPVSHFVP